MYILKPGDTINKILYLSGLPRTTCLEIISTLKAKVSLRKCKTGDKVYIVKDGDKLIEFKYEQQKSTWIIDSLMNIYEPPVTEKLIYLRGTVRDGNLWNSLISAQATPQLVYQFAEEVFPWDIDFNTETRNGDKFEVFAVAKYIENRFIGYDRILFARYLSGRRENVGIYYSKKGASYYNLAGKSLQRAFLKAPLSYIRISSGYSYRRFHPILRRWRPHQGVDYAAPYGTPVRSIGKGKIIFAGWRRGFGKQVIIKHPNGFKSYYAHLAKFAKGIRKGKWIKQGEIIGKVGSTGLSTGPHLDFRLKKGKKWVNPLKLKPPHTYPLRGKELEEYKEYINKLLTLIEGIKVLQKTSRIFVKLES